jgi:hypothetical protein
MNIMSALQFVENTQLSTAIREGALLYPVIGGFRLLAIGLFDDGPASFGLRHAAHGFRYPRPISHLETRRFRVSGLERSAAGKGRTA